MNNVMDLFAGIGGASYAGELIGNWRTVCYVEWDKFCQRVVLQRIKDGILTMRRSGETSPPSTGNRGLDQWILSRRVFLARHFQLQDSDGESRMNGTCGLKPSESLMRYDLDTHSWKTYQGLLALDISTESSVTLPKSGMTQGGLLYPLPMLEHRTLERGSGYWPTPTRQDGENNGGASQYDRNTIPLNAAVKHRTPTTTNRGRYNGGTSIRRTYPTPSASMMTEADMEQARFAGNSLDRPDYQEVSTGSLNPNWVEWLMGYPIGATDLRDSVILGYHWWLQLHGKS